MNSCQNYTLYINLHILLNILSKATSNIHQVHEKITRIDQKDKKSIVSYYHMNCCLQKFTTHQFTYFISKMMEIQHVHQKIHAKQFLLL